MKKIILVLALFATVGNAKDMCLMHLKTGTKYMELASVQTTKTARNLYIQFAIESDINAKYACDKSLTKTIKANIKRLKRIIK